MVIRFWDNEIKFYLFLEKDFQGLEDKIVRLEKEIRRVAGEGGLAARQTSETWHDNFGFEDSERQRRSLDAELRKFKEMKNRARIVEASDSANQVGIGRRVILENLADGKQSEIIVGSYCVLDKSSDKEISYEAPLIKPFIGAKIGDEKGLIRGEKKEIFKIISIT